MANETDSRCAPILNIISFLVLSTMGLMGQDLGELSLGLSGPDPGNMNVPWEENGITMRMMPYPGTGCTGPNCYAFDGIGIWIYPALLEVDVPNTAPIGQIEIDLTDWCGANCTEIRLECSSGLVILAEPNNPFSPETIVIPIPSGEIPEKLQVGGFETYIDNIRFIHGSLTHSYNGPNFPSRALTSHASGRPFGVTADGSNVSTFRLRSLDSQWILALSGSDEALDGKLTLVSSSQDGGKLYRYKHPEFIPANAGHKRSIQVLVRDKVGGMVIASFPIDLWRCPVVLVHGLNSSGREFNRMASHLISSGKYVSRQIAIADYSATNKAAFRTNGLVPLRSIYDLIAKHRSAGIAMGRADLIGHSMGGILSRLSQLSPANKDNIHRIITLNTPHAGTQLANFARDTTSNLRNSLCSALSNIGFDLCGVPASEDLSVRSQALLSLNGSTPKYPVPVHAISTTLPVPPVIPESEGQFNWEINSGLALPFMLGRFSLNTLYQGLFDGDHDWVVPTVSQYGGLSAATTQMINDQFHIGSTQNLEMLDKVLNILMEDHSSALFDLGGFDPPLLEYSGAPLLLGPSQISDKSRDEPLISIVSPLPGDIFHHGDLLEISVEGSLNLDGIILFMAQGSSSFLRKEIDGSEGVWMISLDSMAIGRRLILAIGVDTLGMKYAIDSTWIIVDAKDQVLSVSAEPDSIYLARGTSGLIRLEANLGSYRSEIYQLPGVDYSFSSGNASWDDPIGVTGNSIGTDSLKISFNGLNTPFIPIGIYEPDSIELPLWVVMDGTGPSCGIANGSIKVHPKDGLPPYAYVWDDGTTDSIRSNLSVGTYSVSVTDALGQVVRRSFPLEAIPAPIAQITGTNSTCDEANGSIELVVGQGSPPYSILWSNGETTLSQKGLGSGTYYLTLTDASGCITRDSVQIGQVPSISIEVFGEQPNCDATDGKLEVMYQNAEALSFLWNTGDTSFQINGLPGGLYSVTVTDVNLCTAVDSFLLLDRASPLFDLGPDTTLQAGQTLIIGYPVDEPGWTFLWSTGQITHEILIEKAGAYYLSVTNSVDCSWADSILVDYLSSIEPLLGLNAISVHPNPTNGLFHLKLEFNRQAEVLLQLLDLSGAEVLRQNMQVHSGVSEYQVDARGLPSGSYILVLHQEGRQSTLPLLLNHD